MLSSPLLGLATRPFSGYLQPKAHTYAHFGHLPAVYWPILLQYSLHATETCVRRPRAITSNHLGPSHSDRVCLVPARDDFQEWEDLVVPCL